MATLATSLGPPSAAEAGTHDEAVSELDLREADMDLGEGDLDLDAAGAPEAGAHQSSTFAKSTTFKAFCDNHHIAMEAPAAYTHTFNAHAEGAVRMVNEHMRCLLRRATWICATSAGWYVPCCSHCRSPPLCCARPRPLNRRLR